MSERTVLFVCLHGAAKSAMAAARFERLAAARGIAARADFAGTEPDPEMAPRVVRELLAEGTDRRGQKPRRVTAEEAEAAWRVVTFGCDLASIAPGVPVERWDDVPAVSAGYEAARAAIAARVRDPARRVRLTGPGEPPITLPPGRRRRPARERCRTLREVSP